MTLTRYGLREWLAVTILALILIGVVMWLGLWWLSFVILIVWAAVVSFFRDPVRTPPTNIVPGIMLAPADGVISRIERVDNHPATGGPSIIIRIFLSVLDVHLNRAPCDCEVVSCRHTPGKYLNAQTEESARVNESNLITLKIATGETIGLRQVAGMIARRIVCPVQPGQRFARGEKFGMIKFGSTTELILPRPEVVKVHVHEGEKVRGGLTQLATYPPLNELRAKAELAAAPQAP